MKKQESNSVIELLWCGMSISEGKAVKCKIKSPKLSSNIFSKAIEWAWLRVSAGLIKAPGPYV